MRHQEYGSAYTSCVQSIIVCLKLVSFHISSDDDDDDEVLFLQALHWWLEAYLGGGSSNRID